MNPRLLCVLTGGVLLAGCGTTTATPHSTAVPATATPLTVPASAGPAAPTQAAATQAATQVSIRTDPKNAYKAGLSDLRHQNFAAAAQHFRQAIKNHQNTAGAYAGLGNADLRLGKYADGYKAYVKAVNLKPSDPNNLYGAALAAYTSKQFPDSIRYATEYIQLRPKVAAGYHLRMLANDSLARPKPQLADAEAIARLSPHNPQAYNDLGIAYGNNKKYRQSLAAFAKAIKLDGANYSFYFNRAVIENIMKNRVAALADMKKAQELAPTKQTKAAISALERRIQKGK
jgi:tetratricopeptide (TPR) repeat protein